MRPIDHIRRTGHLDALKELHKRVAEDLRTQRGDIKPAKILHAYYLSRVVLIRRVRLVKTA